MMKAPNWKALTENVKVPGNARVWALAGVCLVLLALAVMVVRASGAGSGAQRGGLPAPGTMRLVSVERVEDRAGAEARQNLLPGGDFRTWWAGAPAPQGVLAPDPGASRLERAEGISQIWQRPEAPGLIAPRMRLEAGKLPAGTYELEALASGTSGGTVALGLWGHYGGPVLVPIDDDFITILPGEGQAKRYARRFTLDQPGLVVVSPHALFGMLPDSKVVWHAMRLTRVGGTG
jgi:hypothetical protein